MEKGNSSIDLEWTLLMPGVKRRLRSLICFCEIFSCALSFVWVSSNSCHTCDGTFNLYFEMLF